MKYIFYAFVAMSLFFVACNKSNNETVAAPPPMSNECIQQTNTHNPYGTYNPYNSYNSYNPYGNGVNNGTCNSQIYNRYSAYGFSAYPYTNFYNYNWANGGYSYMPLCHCPTGSRPVYNGTIGMGCVNIQYFNPIAVGVYYYSLTPNNYQWVNWTQVSNISGSVSNINNCYQQVALSCFIDTPGTCGSGLVCQPTSGGSRLGICRQQ